MTYAIGRKNNKKSPKKTGYATKNSAPKVDLEAIKRQKAGNDLSVLVKAAVAPETSLVVSPPTPQSTFVPVILEAKHDVVGRTWSQWHQHLSKNNPLKSIPAERQHTFDPEVASTIYRLAGEVVRKSVDSGSWNDQPKFKDMLSDVANKAMNYNILNSSQLLPFLRATVQILQEELSADVQDMFDAMEELKESGETASTNQKEEWIRLLMSEVGQELLQGTQEYLYGTLSARWSYLTDDKGVAPDRLDRLELSYKFGTATCPEESFQQQCLKDLAKCLGSIEPADWRWVEPLEQFRSRAWALVEYERGKFAGILEEEFAATPTADTSMPEELRSLREQIRKWPQDAVRPAQATIATSPPSTLVQVETFGERALRLFQKATVELPDVTPTVELAASTTDPLVLAACARSTNFDVLVAVYNNPRAPLDVLEKIMEDDRIMQLAVQQSEDRARGAK